MNWKATWENLIRDVLMTCTGIGLCVSQIFRLRPSDVLLVTGLALTVPALQKAVPDAARHMLSSSPPPAPPTPQPPPSPSPPEEVTGDD